MARQEKEPARTRKARSTSTDDERPTALNTMRPTSPAAQQSPERSNGRNAVIADTGVDDRQFAAVFASTTVGVAVLSLSAEFIQVNDSYCDIVGYSREELARLTCGTLTHPDDRAEMDEKIKALVAGAIPTFDIVKRYIRKDGALIWVRNSVSLTCDAEGTPLSLVALCQDITERRQSRLLLAEQNRLLELAASGHPLTECLAEVTRAATRLRPGMRVAILLADEARARFSTIFATKIPPSFGRGLQDAPINDLMIGTCGTAVYSGNPIDCQDIAADERWSKEWRDLCIAHGIRACHSEPVLGADGQPLASLMLCFDTPHEPSDWELRIAHFGAHIASISIERARVVSRLRAREADLARELAEMKRLQEISVRLIQAGNLDELYAQILDTATALMASDMGSMQMFDPDRNALRLLAWKGFAPEAAAFWEWVDANAHSSCAQAQRTGERVIVKDVEACHFMAGTADQENYRLSGVQAMQSTPLISRDGRLLGMISTHWRSTHKPAERDLSLLDVLARQAADLIERRQAEEASAYLAAIVTSSYDAIVSKTLQGIVTSWNTSAEQMFGFTAEEMVGQSILRIIPPERTSEEDYILSCVRAGERIEHFETVRMTKDGQPLDVSLTISPIRDSSGKIIGASKIARDITERKRLEDALRASERRMNEFLGIAAHELRTPLTSITANVQMTLKQVRTLIQAASADDDGDNGDNQRGPSAQLQRAALLLERTDRQILRLGRLVNDLVDVSRIQAGKLEMRPEVFDPLPIVREAVREQSVSWPDRTISLTVQPHLVSSIIGDADRIGQVITNYLTNALKYSPDHTEVVVTVRADEGNLRVEVHDQGPGLSARQQAHLFERCYRAPGIEQQSGSGVGLGLGLHICKTIVERHGGSVGVTSVAGEGSVFWFTLPLSRPMEHHE